MKPVILLLIAVIFLNSDSYSQLYKFRASQFVCTRYKNKLLEPPEFKDLKDMRVDFDMDSSILHIYSPTPQIFRLKLPPISGGEADSTMTYKFKSIDKNGVECIVTQIIYEASTAQHLGAVILEYPDKTFMYYLEEQ